MTFRKTPKTMEGFCLATFQRNVIKFIPDFMMMTMMMMIIIIVINKCLGEILTKAE